jgi:Ulp1 family protease
MVMADPAMAKDTWILDTLFYTTFDSTKKNAAGIMERYYSAAKFVSVNLFKLKYLMIPIHK